jgi:cytochrome c553
MRLPLALGALLALTVQPAAAADAYSFQWSEEKFDKVAAADVAEGKKLAKEFRCKKCHNNDGISDDPEIPSIAGQRATYMYKQLMDFKHQVRDDSDMRKVARKMSEEDMIHVSAWYESLERPQMIGGQALLVVKVCDSCHEKDMVEKDNRIEVAPILKGQVPQYLEMTMMAFKDAERSNDLFERMQSVSHKLTDEEIRSLARYYGTEPLEE